MNEFERIIERCNELGVNDIAEIKSILKESIPSPNYDVLI